MSDTQKTYNYHSINELNNFISLNISNYTSITIDIKNNKIYCSMLKRRGGEPKPKLKYKNMPNYHKMYTVWRGIVQRCYNVNHKHYNRYGGRGILMCDEWRYSPDQFYLDMNPSYQENLTLDRIDNDKGYNKDNCKWSNGKDQHRNTENSTIIKYQNKTYHILNLLELLKFDPKYHKHVSKKCSETECDSWEEYMDKNGITFEDKEYCCKKHFYDTYNISSSKITSLMQRYYSKYPNIPLPNLWGLNWYIQNIPSFSVNLKKVAAGKKIYLKEIFI